jgi:hypothetical protein
MTSSAKPTRDASFDDAVFARRVAGELVRLRTVSSACLNRYHEARLKQGPFRATLSLASSEPKKLPSKRQSVHFLMAVLAQCQHGQTPR